MWSTLNRPESISRDGPLSDTSDVTGAHHPAPCVFQPKPNVGVDCKIGSFRGMYIRYIFEQRGMSDELPDQCKMEAYGKCTEVCSGFHASRAPCRLATSLWAVGLLAMSENSLSL